MEILNLEGIFSIFALYQYQKTDAAFSHGSTTVLDTSLPQDSM